MKQGFMRRVKRLIEQADIIIEVLDARFPQATRNPDLERSITQQNKQLILVLNKADLVSASKARKWQKKLKAVALSAKEHKGLNDLRARLSMALKGREGVVGVIGYPNTGKSSLINALKGRKVAPVSLKAGFTRGEKIIRVSQKVLLIDSPGIIPFGEKDEFRLMLTSSKNPNQIKEAELVALQLLELFLQENAQALKEAYGIESNDPEKALEQIALKKNKLLKGGLPDTETAARLFLWDYQKGKIRLE